MLFSFLTSLFHCMNISQSIFSHVDEYSACFQFGVISNNAVRNILLYVFLWDVYV